MSGPRAQRVSFAPTLATLFLLTATISVPGPASALAESLGPAEHVLPDAEGFRPELWSPDGSMLVLTRDHRDIRILETESGLLWDVYSMAVPSPVRIPIAWDSTGTALRFLDYPAEAIRTYETKSGALSAFHLRDPFLLREVWRGIEAPETRAIVWWDPGSEAWEFLSPGGSTAGSNPEPPPGFQMEEGAIDLSAQWILGTSGEWQPREPVVIPPAIAGGEVLHIAPGGKRIAWLTPTGLYTAPIE